MKAIQNTNFARIQADKEGKMKKGQIKRVAGFVVSALLLAVGLGIFSFQIGGKAVISSGYHPALAYSIVPLTVALGVGLFCFLNWCFKENQSDSD